MPIKPQTKPPVIVNEIGRPIRPLPRHLNSNLESSTPKRHERTDRYDTSLSATVIILTSLVIGVMVGFFVTRPPH